MAENGLSQIGGRLPERLKGTDCKSVGYAYVGSNPTPPIACRFRKIERQQSRKVVCMARALHVTGRKYCGCSSMVEQQPSKLNTRVRFPSPALLTVLL